MKKVHFLFPYMEINSYYCGVLIVAPKITNNMKNSTIIIALILFGLLSALTSCKKDDPQPKTNIITYKVECARCLVSARTMYDTNQNFVISGKWSYDVAAGSLDSAILNIETPAAVGPIPVKSSISINNKVAATEDFNTGKKIYGILIKQFLN